VPVGDVMCPYLVGRDAELAGLGEGLAAARLGSGRAVFVVGPAGIGKSRLLREIAATPNVGATGSARSPLLGPGHAII
jgi:MoxR-like ATPase